MARKCKVYKKDNEPCSEVVTAVDSDVCVPDLLRQPENTSYLCRVISDPTGNKNGRGITNKGANKDTECFTKTLVTPITVMVHTSKGDKNITFEINKNVVDEVKGIFNRIFKETKFKIDSIYTYGHRYTQGSSKGDTSLSYHSYGIAIDINAAHNPYSNGYANKCSICGKINSSDVKDNTHIRNENHEVVKIFKSYGWYWGGLWKRKQDYMHFCKING